MADDSALRIDVLIYGGGIAGLRADILNLTNGAELDLVNDGRVRILRRLETDSRAIRGPSRMMPT